MTCEACKYKVEHLIGEIAGVNAVTADFHSGAVEIEVSDTLSPEIVQQKLLPTQKYFVLEEPAKPSFIKTYKPLFIVFSYVLLVSAIAALPADANYAWRFCRFFMAGFFFAFSFFKMLDIPAFARSFAVYDIIAQKAPVYGYMYPFIELSLGFCHMLDWNPLLTNLVTLVVMSIGTVGVVQNVLKKKAIQCACLGTIFNLPMSVLTVIENGLMIAMSLLALINHFVS